MNSVYFPSNRIYFLRLPEVVCRSTVEDTSFGPFPAITAIPSLYLCIVP